MLIQHRMIVELNSRRLQSILVEAPTIFPLFHIPITEGIFNLSNIKIVAL